jgi:hypothetical protein
VSKQVFLSYAREDAPEADRLAARLEAEGFSVYLDRSRIRAGEFGEQLERAIATCDVFLVLLSAASVRSTYVGRELYVAADDYERPILPVLLEDVDLSRFRLVLAGLQRVDYTARSDAQLAAVVDGVYRTRAAGRRSRRDPGRAVRMVGTVIAALGVVTCMAAIGFFILQMIEVAGTGMSDRLPDFRPFAVAMGVFFVGMVVAGSGEAVRRIGRRR